MSGFLHREQLTDGIEGTAMPVSAECMTADEVAGLGSALPTVDIAEEDIKAGELLLDGPTSERSARRGFAWRFDIAPTIRLFCPGESDEEEGSRREGRVVETEGILREVSARESGSVDRRLVLDMRPER